MAFIAARFFYWWEDSGAAPPFHPPTSDYRLRLFGDPILLHGEVLTLQMP